MDCCAAHASASSGPVSIALLFGTGLVMSAGHCLGMCGPLVTAFVVAQRGQGRRAGVAWLSLLIYQSGRISSYAAIGAALGGVGSFATLAAGARGFSAALSGIAGVLTLAAGFSLLGWIPLQRALESLPLGAGVARTMASLVRSPRAGASFLLGIANGLLPCGPVAAAAIGAAAGGSAAFGAMGMAAYGVGTAPALLVLGSGVGMLSPRARLRLFRLGAALVLLLGTQLALRGLHGAGLIGAPAIGPVVLW